MTVGHRDAGAPVHVADEMGMESGEGGLRVGTGGHPQADLRAGSGDEGIGRVGDSGRVDREHADGGFRPHPRGQWAGADQADAVEHTGLGAEAILRVVDVGRRHAAGDALDGHISRGVVQGGQEPGQHGQRIGHRPAEHARVHGVIERGDLDDAVGDAPQRGREGRPADGEVGRVGQDDRVRDQQVAVLGEERFEGR